MAQPLSTGENSGSQAQAVESKQMTISNFVDALADDASRAGVLAGRLSNLADRLCGSAPQAVQGQGAEGTEVQHSVLNELRHDHERLFENLGEIEGQINRIENVL